MTVRMILHEIESNSSACDVERQLASDQRCVDVPRLTIPFYFMLSSNVLAGIVAKFRYRSNSVQVQIQLLCY